MPGDQILVMMPLFHTAGCGLLVLGGLANGATLLLARGFDAAVLARVIARERPEFVLGVPTMIVGLIEEAETAGLDLSSVKSVIAGGAMVAPDLVAKSREVFGAPIQIVYGQTETSPVITHACHDDVEPDLSGTIGQPLAHMDVAILAMTDKSVCPIGVQGEICCRGYHVMAGYNDNPEATAAAIDKDGWLHTGDLGTMDSRGYLKITGRVKDMIIRGGENLFPAEIENAMLEHPAILEVAVVGIPDDKWGELVACFMRAARCRAPGAARAKGVHPRPLVAAKDARLLDLGRSVADDRIGQDPEIRAARRLCPRRLFGRGGFLERTDKLLFAGNFFKLKVEHPIGLAMGALEGLERRLVGPAVDRQPPAARLSAAGERGAAKSGVERE